MLLEIKIVGDSAELQEVLALLAKTPTTATSKKATTKKEATTEKEQPVVVVEQPTVVVQETEQPTVTPEQPTVTTEQPTVTTEQSATTVTVDDLRAEATKLIRANKQLTVNALVAKCGGTKLSNVPEDRRAELLALFSAEV